MGVLSIGVLARINDQVDTLTSLSEQTNQSRQMIYEVTAQSHYRAMELLTDDPSYADKIAASKNTFNSILADVRSHAEPARPAFFAELASADADFAASSELVTQLYAEGKERQALQLHITEEHAISHELEDSLNVLIDDSQRLVAEQTEAFASHRRFLTIAVASFAGASLLAALALGAVLSWSLIRPVRRVDGALERIAGGISTRGSTCPTATSRQPHQEPEPHERTALDPLPGLESLNTHLRRRWMPRCRSSSEPRA